MGNVWTQFRPPKPEFTEQNVPDLSGKVYLVTGASSGIGKEIARLLYSTNAKVYVAARSEAKCRKAIDEIQAVYPSSKGSLLFLKLDLADLSTIKGSVEEFLSKESKLHVLFNNAGVMSVAEPPEKTVQGYEMNLGVNCLGSFLFTKLLTPVLIKTAQTAPPNTVRVVWVSSTIDLAAAKNVGIPIDNLDYHRKVGGMDRYGLSKTGNWLHAVEYARLHKANGLISMALNPGNLYTELGRNHTAFVQWLLSFIVHPAYLGGYSLLFAGLSPKITMAETGGFLWPWGRFGTVRKDLEAAVTSEAEGGNGTSKKFWDWSEEQVEKYS